MGATTAGTDSRRRLGWGALFEAMAIYQCFFFEDGKVTYWENIEAGSEGCLREALGARLRREGWHTAEAWLGGALRLRIDDAVPPM